MHIPYYSIVIGMQTVVIQLGIFLCKQFNWEDSMEHLVKVKAISILYIASSIVFNYLFDK